MIGLFTNPTDTEFIRIVSKAVSDSAPGIKFRVFSLEERPDSRALESREFFSEIMGMDACIIDGDQRDIVAYAAELGSLAGGMSHWIGSWGRDDHAVSELDRRILLLSRKPRGQSPLFRYFSDYYTILSLADIPPSHQVQGISEWLRDTLDRSAPKVFISYRSSQKEYATKVADSLRRRGAIVWFDQISIQPGDSIPDVINRGLGWCTHMVLIVDETFFESDWTKAEYESVLYRHLSGGRRRGYGDISERAILPLFLVDPASEQMPPLLRRIRGIDCRNQRFRTVMDKLWNAVLSMGPR